MKFDAYKNAHQIAELIEQEVTQNSIREEGDRTNDRFIDSSFASDVSSMETVKKRESKAVDNTDLDEKFSDFKERTDRLISYLKQ